MNLATKVIIIASSAVVLSNAASAISVNIIANSASGRYLSSSEATLPTGSVVKYGVLDVSAYNALSASQKQNFAAVSGVFSELGETAVNSSGDVVSTGNIHNLPENGVGFSEQLYTWVFNSGTPGSATEWGIFTSSSTNWGTGTDNIGTSTLSTSFETMSAVVGTINSGSTDTYSLQAVPEPSTYAAIAGFAVLGVVALRRRRAGKQ